MKKQTQESAAWGLQFCCPGIGGRQERACNRSFCCTSRGRRALRTARSSTSGFQNSESIHFCCFCGSVCRPLWCRLQETVQFLCCAKQTLYSNLQSYTLSRAWHFSFSLIFASWFSEVPGWAGHPLYSPTQAHTPVPWDSNDTSNFQPLQRT